MAVNGLAAAAESSQNLILGLEDILVSIAANFFSSRLRVPLRGPLLQARPSLLFE